MNSKFFSAKDFFTYAGIERMESEKNYSEAANCIRESFNGVSSQYFERHHSAILAHFQGQHAYVLAYPNDADNYEPRLSGQNYIKPNHPQREVLLPLYTEIIRLLKDTEYMSYVHQSLYTKQDIITVLSAE